MHNLVPKHELMTAQEKDKLFAELHTVQANIPKIRNDDPALKLFNIAAAAGDVIKITRKESTGTTPYYRQVVE